MLGLVGGCQWLTQQGWRAAHARLCEEIALRCVPWTESQAPLVARSALQQRLQALRVLCDNELTPENFILRATCVSLEC